MPPARILLDTDPAMGTLGGDPEDCFAILLALASPELAVEGITIVQGNVPAERGYANARHLLALADRGDVPLYRGVLEPIRASRKRQRRHLERQRRLEQVAPEVEPPAGEPHAVDFLIEHIGANPGELTLVTIGPLSNIATAFEREPALPGKLVRIVAMAGAAVCRGNISPAAEFNVWQDPDAAHVVFESGVPLTMVGLDVCHQTHLRESELLALAQSEAPLGRFVGEASLPFIELRRRVSDTDSLHLYDSLAVAAAFRPEWLGTKPGWVAIETEGRHSEGETVAWLDPVLRKAVARREPNADVALEVDAEAFQALFQERVLAPLRDPRPSAPR